jgi:hypothetical protein
MLKAGYKWTIRKPPDMGTRYQSSGVINGQKTYVGYLLKRRKKQKLLGGF